MLERKRNETGRKKNNMEIEKAIRIRNKSKGRIDKKRKNMKEHFNSYTLVLLKGNVLL